MSFRVPDAVPFLHIHTFPEMYIFRSFKQLNQQQHRQWFQLFFRAFEGKQMENWYLMLPFSLNFFSFCIFVFLICVLNVFVHSVHSSRILFFIIFIHTVQKLHGWVIDRKAVYVCFVCRSSFHGIYTYFESISNGN